MGSDISSSSGIAKSKHVKDCRRYRNKMSKKFEELTRMIPGTSADAGCNHRAKVLDQTMRVLETLVEETNQMQLELALTDRQHLSAWVEKNVAGARDLASACQPLLELLVLKCGWKFAEFWVVNGHGDQGTRQQTLKMTSHMYAKRLSEAETHFFGDLCEKHSGENVQPQTGLLKRALETMYCQTMQLGQTQGEQNAGGLTTDDVTLKVCLSVPILVHGQVRGIATFYDTELRKDDGMSVAECVATVVGNVFGCSPHARPKSPAGSAGPTDAKSSLSNLSSTSECPERTDEQSAVPESRAKISYLLNGVM